MLKAFCTARTVFSAFNQTHLSLKIKSTIHSDGGWYGVGTVFENLSHNHLEMTNLSVIELKLDGKLNIYLDELLKLGRLVLKHVNYIYLLKICQCKKSSFTVSILSIRL